MSNRLTSNEQGNIPVHALLALLVMNSTVTVSSMRILTRRIVPASVKTSLFCSKTSVPFGVRCRKTESSCKTQFLWTVGQTREKQVIGKHTRRTEAFSSSCLD